MALSVGGGYWCAAQLLSHQTAIICAIIAMVLSTGALHEDGFADFCDGFGGGYGKEAILRIMKDSHVGCYGVIGLVLIFALRFGLLSNFNSSQMMEVIILAQGASRLAPVAMVRTSTYARTENSKASQSALGISYSGVVVAAAIAITPLALVNWQAALLYLAAMAIVFPLFRVYLHRQIGGFTGDTLGALQIIGEIIFYTTYLAASLLV